MDCLHKNKQGAEILTGHLAGTLDGDREIELERHAKDCPDCRALLRVWDRLEEFPAPALSEDFDHRLYARIAHEARLPWWRRMWLPTALPWRPLWRPVLPLAAACAVLVLALAVRNPDANDGVKEVRIEQKASPQNVGSQNAGPQNGPEVEQVVQALDDLELLSPVSSEPAGAI